MARATWMKLAALSLAIAVGPLVPSQAGAAMIININPNASLASNSAALTAFNAAAAQWTSLFSDSITINISASLANFNNPSIIGSASATFFAGDYDTIRNAMVADAANEASNAIVAALPTVAQFSAFIPSGFSLLSQIALTSANAKALGFAVNVASDAAISFNTQFGFDYDRSDGIGAGLIDFQTVAAHEIGHALGFVSVVDVIDQLIAQNRTGAISINPLDLFRFSTTSGNNPTTTSQFTAIARNLVPGAAAIFDDLTTEVRFSTGFFNGDGRQASHWKDDGITGINLGIMDPTLGFGTITGISANDIRAFDLIGYDLTPPVGNAVPEPGTLAACLAGIGLAAVRVARSRSRRAAA